MKYIRVIDFQYIGETYYTNRKEIGNKKNFYDTKTVSFFSTKIDIKYFDFCKSHKI